MRILKLFRQLYQDYSTIHYEATNFPGFYLGNFLKITIDKTIKTIGYIWHYLFRNKKYDDELVVVGNYKILANNISINSIIYSTHLLYTNIKFY